MQSELGRLAEGQLHADGVRSFRERRHRTRSLRGGRSPPPGPSLHGHGLREVARLIDVAAFRESDVIGEQLQRNVQQQRVELGLGLRYLDDAFDRGAATASRVASRRRSGPPRARISAIVDRFFAKRSSRGSTTTVGVSASINASGPCFSSDAGISFGVQVADFFEFQARPRARRQDRPRGRRNRRRGSRAIACAIVAICASLARICSTCRGNASSAAISRAPLAVDRSRKRPEMNREQRERDGRARERLGRDDGDLGPRVQVDAAAAFARDRAADDVDDPEHAAALALDLLHGGERVERLAGLADGDVQRVVLDHGVAVAKLGRRLRVRRYARELLDELRAHHARDVRRAAAQDLHAPNLEQLARRILEAAEARRLEARLEAAAERAADRIRLLGHFLAHVSARARPCRAFRWPNRS